MSEDINIELIDDKIVWKKKYNELSDEQIKICETYEEKKTIISKLRTKINKTMNELYPLEKIQITEEEIQKKQSEDSISNDELIIDFNKIDGMVFNEFFSILYNKRNILDAENKAYFDKIFIESGLLYTLLFIADANFKDKINVIINNLENMKKLYPNGEFSIEQLDKIVNTIVLNRYCDFSDFNILTPSVCYKIATDDTFILDTSELGKKTRVKYGTKYNVLASSYIDSSIPFPVIKKEGIIAQRYKNNDPNILISGIDTDACFRIFGVDNDFLLYTMFDKNGIVLKLTDESGNFIGRCSGFRNGNIVYFNQARSIYDKHGTPGLEIIELQDSFRNAIIEFSKKLIEETKDTAEPIEHVVILKAYGFSKEEKLSMTKWGVLPSVPMDTISEDWQLFRKNDKLQFRDSEKGFTTDYCKGQSVLILASKEGCTLEKPEDVRQYNPQIIYQRPRKPINFYYIMDQENFLSEINRIKTTYSYINDLKINLEINLDEIERAVYGEDWYCILYKDGKVEECLIPLDPRAKEEMNQYKNSIISNKTGFTK